MNQKTKQALEEAKETLEGIVGIIGQESHLGWEIRKATKEARQALTKINAALESGGDDGWRKYL